MSLRKTSMTTRYQQPFKQHIKVSVWNSILDLSNSMLGPGMVSISFGFQIVGLGMGTIMLVLCMFCTWYTLHLMVISAEKAHSSKPIPKSIQKLRGEPSFSSIGSALNVSILTDLIVIVSCLGLCVSYLIAIGEAMPLLLKDWNIEWSLLQSKFFWTIVGTLLILPISFEEDVGNIWWYNGTCLICAFYLALLIIIASIKPKLYWEVIFLPEWKFQIFDTIPIFVFAFTCHQNMFSIYKNIHAHYLTGQELDSAKLRHIYTAIDISVLFVGVLYCLVGLCGFLTFVSPSISVTIGKMAYCILAGLSFPEQSQSCRVAMDSLWDTIQSSSYMKRYTPVAVDERDVEYPVMKKKLNWLTWLIFGISLGCAFGVPNLEACLALVGATGGVAMCYVLPAIFIWKVGLPDATTKSTAMFIALLGICSGALQVISLFIR